MPSASETSRSLDELAPDTIDLLACPELNEVNFGAETDDSAADLVALVELLTSERHGSVVVERRVVLHLVSTRLPHFAFASSSHIGSMSDLNRW